VLEIKKILLVGSGNVATHLAINLKSKNYNIQQIFSRSTENAKDLAKKVDSDYTDKPKNIVASDLTIIAVNDDSIKDIIDFLPDVPTVHTSGYTNINILKNSFTNYGVIYPLQSFKKNIELNFTDIPFLIEANSKEFENKLIKLCSCFTNNAIRVNSSERKKIHLAAVFACNFSNHMQVIAKEIMDDAKINFELLIPLIKKTFSSLEVDPKLKQTGPAVRKDFNILEKHINLIQKNEYREIYKLISDSIIKKHDNFN
tara:strand:- start:164 stop:934 length:771 start_codon:yes stop_codon:yes gene_type:complete